MSETLHLGNTVRQVEVSAQFPPYTKVVLTVGKGENQNVYVAGSDGGLVLELENPWGSQQIANHILTQIRGFRYLPFTAGKVHLDPAAELGDEIETNSFRSFIAKQDTDFGRLMPSSIAAPGAQELHEYPYVPQSDRKIIRRIERSATELRVEIGRISTLVSNIEDGLSSYSTIEQTAREIRTHVEEIREELKSYSTITQTDNKIETAIRSSERTRSSIFRQDTVPTANKIGDLWYCLDTIYDTDEETVLFEEGRLYQWDGVVWRLADDKTISDRFSNYYTKTEADAAFSIDNNAGKISALVSRDVYGTGADYSGASPPANPEDGEIWYCTATSGSYQKDTPYRWNDTDEVWEPWHFSDISRKAASLDITIDGITSRVSQVEQGLQNSDVETKIQQFANSIQLSATNNATNTASTITITADGMEAQSKTISFSGLVKFSNLTDGTTQISGSNIKTGNIQASNGGNSFSINTATGKLSWTMDNSSLATDGTMYFIQNSGQALAIQSGAIYGYRPSTDSFEGRIDFHQIARSTHSWLDQDYVEIWLKSGALGISANRILMPVQTSGGANNYDYALPFGWVMAAETLANLYEEITVMAVENGSQVQKTVRVLKQNATPYMVRNGMVLDKASNSYLYHQNYSAYPTYVGQA